MLLFPSAKFRKPRRRAKGAPSAPPAALTLVAAAFDDASEVPAMTLTFDRAIDVAGLDGYQVTLADGVYAGLLYAATGTVTMLSPASVRIELNTIGEAEPGGVHLTATAASGIVAVDDGGTWGGVTDLELPFP